MSPCGNDPAGAVGTKCRPGMRRLANYVMREFGTGDLGCFNPASRAGGVPSLHADGRAFDAALNAHDPAQRGRGDRLMRWLVDNADRIQLQEMLWRGYVWSCRNRHLGIRFTGIQQAAHENHVHFGVSYFCADNFTEDWLGAAPTPQPEEDDLGTLSHIDETGATEFALRFRQMLETNRAEAANALRAVIYHTPTNADGTGEAWGDVIRKTYLIAVETQDRLEKVLDKLGIAEPQ